MKIVGLTGGIGSGKTTVAHFFAELGIPIYIADIEAKRLTNTSKIIKRKLLALLGEEAYTEEGINRVFVADKIFSDKELLKKVNKVIHPRVAQHFKRWIKKQDAPYCIKEAAILFENGSYAFCDAIILVTAPIETRIERVLQRDNTTRAAVESRMDNQWSDDKKLALATYHIENITTAKTHAGVQEIHRQLLTSLVTK